MEYVGKAAAIPNGFHKAEMGRMAINGEDPMMDERQWWLDEDGDILMQGGEAYIHLIREGEYIGVYGGERYRGDKVNSRIPVAEFAKALGLEVIKATAAPLE